MADGLDLSGFASTVDISHSRTAVRLTGDRAADTLAKLGSADFSDHMTPNGAALGNGIAGVTCDIVRDDQRCAELSAVARWQLHHVFPGRVARRRIGVLTTSCV